jgi:uncharacterized membrane protein YphA (DoxX/SURF4 family)/thiol-disulfide isomerase/thioredoxin
MDSVVLGIQLLLAAVFATAGVAKLLDRPGSRSALEGLGVPARVVPVAAWLLPLVELATAVALVVHPTARGGAIAALVLLLAFMGGIARAMSRGEAPDCHCFGQLHSAPAGRGTLVRNAALAGIAAVVAVHGAGPPIDAWVDARTPAELAAVGASVLAALLASLSLRLWLDNRGLRNDLAREREASSIFPPGLPLGASAPAFELPDLHGGSRSLSSLLEGGLPLALIFMGPSCGACVSLLPELGRWQATLADRLTIAVISSGSAVDNFRAREHGLTNVLLQADSELMHAYRVRGTPSAVIVTPDGRIASAAVAGAPVIEPLIRLTLRGETKVPGGGPAEANGARSEQQHAYG